GESRRINTVPKLKTFLKIERHASNVYTRSLFELVQKEIFVGLWHCQIDSKILVEGSEVCIIKESPYVCEMPNKKKKKPQSEDKGKDKAEEDDTVDFFSKKMGFISIFFVFKNANVKMIPQQYILRRWMKNLIPTALRNKRNKYGKKNVVVENYANEATFIVDHCVHLLSKHEPRAVVGVLKPPDVDVNNPTVRSTKGRKKLRIKGGKEKAIEKRLKGMNSCSLCGSTDHNKRKCLGRFEGQDEVVVQKEVCQDEVV
nr:protein FAR1-related sequence 5 [Tanacetum cinerariifolium]